MACSTGVFNWLCSLGSPEIPLEDKWAGVQSLLPAQRELGYACTPAASHALSAMHIQELTGMLTCCAEA